MCIADEQAALIYVNKCGFELIGHGPLRIPPTEYPRVYGLYHADGVTPVGPSDLAAVDALAGKEVRDRHFIIRNQNVRDVHVLVSAQPMRAPDGSIRGAVVLLRDESQRWRAREELKQRERWLHAILDNLPDMAWLKDRDSNYLAINQQFARACGRRVRDIIGKSDLDAWPRELAEKYRADDREIMESRSTKRVEEPLVQADGTVVVIETIKTAIVDEHGDVIGTTGIARDITERKRAEEALRQSKIELEHRVEERTRELERAQEISMRKERLAVLGQLAGGVAHQIRNPLAAIKNATYVLEHTLPRVGVQIPAPDLTATRRASSFLGERGADGIVRLTPEQQVAQSLAIIHEEIRRANDIISGLLDYARIRAPVRQIVSTQDMVAQVLGVADIPDTVRLERAVEGASVAVDPSQVQEALHVLVRNAVDAMPEGGTLVVYDRDEGAWIVLGVEDTGCGVPADIAQRLFEPLLTSKPSGLGLGLVTARTLVEAQGGQLAFVPGVERGARFEIRLPRGP